MRPLIGRRPLFFLLLAAVCAALIPATPAEFRWVNLMMAGIAVFWAVLLAGEDLARRGRRRRPTGPDSERHAGP